MTRSIHILSLALAMLVSASFAVAQEKSTPPQAAQTWSGYLVDKNCGTMIGKKEKTKAMEMGKKHSVACALDEACMASGYGIIHEGTFIKFDDAGDAMAAKYLKGLSKKNDVLVTVSGLLKGEILHVTKISDAPIAPDKKS